MIEFNTKLSLNTYLAKTGSLEGKYCVINDETMQNKKSVYSFINGELLFESGGTTVLNWRTTVDTYALLSGITTPLGMDAVIVTSDETHGNNKTWYQYDGYVWNYKGAYQKRETQSFSSLADVRASILKITDNLTLDFEYITGNDELEVYLDGRLATQYLVEVGDIGFTSKLIKFTIDIPISTDINVRKFVPNIDDEPRTNDEVYVAAFKHNYSDIEKYIKYEKSVVIHYETFADVQNDSLLIKEGQVIRTNGHVTKNDGKGRYWILESADKDFGYKNKTESLFINRLIGADEKQPGELFPLAGSEVAPPETVKPTGQISNRADFKRVWAWAVANGRVVTEAEWSANPGCFSSGDLSTTFRFPLAKDFIRAKESGRNVGSFQNDAIRNITGRFSNVFAETNASAGESFYVNGNYSQGNWSQGNWSGSTINRGWTLNMDASRQVPTATENRPKNIAQQYFIKI